MDFSERVRDLGIFTGEWSAKLLAGDPVALGSQRAESVKAMAFGRPARALTENRVNSHRNYGCKRQSRLASAQCCLIGSSAGPQTHLNERSRFNGRGPLLWAAAPFFRLV